MHLSNKRCSSAFTLIELLLVIGIIAILASIVILAINPTLQLRKAEDANRTATVREIKSAILQYQIDHGFIPSGITSTPTDICSFGVIDPGCVNLDVLVTEDYVTTLDRDILESNVAVTGYEVHVDSGGFISVDSNYFASTGGGDGSGPLGATVISAAEPLAFIRLNTGAVLPIVDAGVSAVNASNLTVSLAPVTSSVISATTNIALVNASAPVVSAVPAAINIASNRAVTINVSADGASTCTANSPYSATACGLSTFSFNTNSITENGSFSITTPETGVSNSVPTYAWQISQVSNILSAGNDIPRNFIEYNGLLYFTAADTLVTGKTSIYKTDGTTITRVSNGNESFIGTFVPFNNELYIRGLDSAGRTRLFKTNGTTISRMTNINNIVSDDEAVDDLTVFGSYLYFTADNGGTTILYRTDGSTITQLTTLDMSAGYPFHIISMFVYSGQLYVVANIGDFFSSHLFSFNGTTLTRVSNESGNIAYVSEVNNVAILLLNNNLYSFNGSSLVQIADTYPAGQDISDIRHVGVYNNELYFFARNSAGLYKLMKTDASVVTQISDINVGGNDLGTVRPGFTIYNNELYFWAYGTNITTGLHLYKTNGSTITKVNNMANTISTAAWPPKVLGDILLTGNSGQSYFHVPTGEILRLTPGTVSNIQEFMIYNGYMYFTGTSTNSKLYRIAVL